MATKPDKSGLSIEQENAIDLLVQGKTDKETAEAVGVCRQTVVEWRLRSITFREEVNTRRKALWDSQTERLRSLVSKAVDVLEGDLQAEDPRLRQNAAIHILNAVDIYGTPREPETGLLASLPEE